VVELLRACPLADRLTILEQDAGLHFLLKVKTELSDRELTDRLLRSGIRIHALSHYCHESGENTRTLVVNYALLDEEALARVIGKLPEVMNN
jgi:GntR family transcriptional regulator/MocR family aminotransferase